jgi:hypothetical protein
MQTNMDAAHKSGGMGSVATEEEVYATIGNESESSPLALYLKLIAESVVFSRIGIPPYQTLLIPWQ